MQARLVLVHSPLVGCGVWEPVARELVADGYSVAVPDLGGTVTGGPPYHLRQARVVADSVADQAAILVGYSRGGSLLATAGMMAGEQVRGYIFVDARLPTPGQSWMQTTPPDLAAHVRGMADSAGWLPPWSQWWAEEELAALLPDPEVRRQFSAGCPPLPLAMFEEIDPPVPGWPVATAGYLQLSEGYDEEVAMARGLGWTVRQQMSHHLALVTQPAQVAGELRALIGQP